MDVAILGPLRVRVAGSWTAIEAPKQRLVFGALLARVGEVVDAERLLDDVWAGRPPDAGLKSLRYHLSKLRDVVAPRRGRDDDGPIRTIGSGYVLSIDREQVDAERFERLAELGRQLLADQRYDQAVDVFSEALDLWRGEAWEDFRYEEFAQPIIRRLEEQRLVAIEDRIDSRLGRGEHIDLVAELRELTTRHPLRERLWAQSMTALYRAGRTSEAAQIFETATAVLGDEFALEPSRHLQSLYRRLADEAVPLAAPLHHSRWEQVLPRRSSSFVGREQELEALAELLTRRRLITIVGAGGVGKTSLALAAAYRAGESHGRVVFVDLAAVDNPMLVASHITRSCCVVGVTSRPTFEDLIAHLGTQPHLVVLDNCEHVVERTSEIVAALLAECSGLTVLATSRRPLHIEGEHVYFTEPLPLPVDASADSVDSNDAVRLFADRAEAALGRFAIDDANREQVVEVCRRLDGLPLGLELAAGRLRALSLDELPDHLGRPYEILADRYRPREQQRSLWATIDWSHRLLSDDARMLLRRISVLRGTFDLAAIAAIWADGSAGGDSPMLDLVTELVETSFLSRADTSGGGFMMLETIREFAQHELECAAESEEARERHATHFAERASVRPLFGSLEELEEVRRLRSDGENRIAALDWAMQHGRAHLAANLAAGLSLRWYAGAGGQDDRRWLEATLRGSDGDVSPEQAHALCALGLSLPWMGRHEEAEAIAEELASVADRLGDPEVAADALWVRAARATVAGEILESHRLFEEGASLLRTAGHPKVAVFLFDLARRELMLGRPAGARTLTDELERVGERWNQPLTKARIALLRGWAAYYQGDVTAALDGVLRSLGDMRRLGLAGPQSDTLLALCDVAAAAQRWDLAEMAAWDLRTLLMGNGEIAALPYCHNTLAASAIDRGDLSEASDLVTESLDVIGRTRGSVALDHALLTAARVAAGLDRFNVAAEIHAARSLSQRSRGLVDPLPVSRLVTREVDVILTHTGKVRLPPQREPLDQHSLIKLASDAVAA